ncbi:MAG: hypothetical protein M3552_00225 [Planctomycetota bacterium]|nr:hypothetical protein [Planctomycetaceae bacterium]MDQ3329072.1 hypothetical protein [Planctomycetota bacterium]
MLRQPRRLYTVAVPTVWAITSLVNFRFPGDEYGGWGAGSLPGLWVVPLIDGSPLPLLPFVLVGGFVVMMALGAILDKLSSPWMPWYSIWLIAAGAIFGYSLSRFPSWDRAMSKNGSIEAYLLPALNLGLLFSTVTMILATGCYRLVKFAVWRWHRLTSDRSLPLP